MAAAVNGIKSEMKGGFIVMKKNVKRFVSMTMAMLVAAGSLAGCGGGGSASTGESAKAAANTGGSSVVR